MQPTRRRKKRPNYGLRTVEVCRSKNGFGFTISGQQPCILSCIVPNSPAEQAGLRPGDYLIAVCGQNVSKVPHDDVVQLIGNCHGVLKLQIAENYYSDSSEEDFVMTIRQKPKHVFKNKINGLHTHPLLLNKSHKLGSSVFDSYSFEDEFEATKSVENNVLLRENESVAVPSQGFNGASGSGVIEESNSVLQSIVGYLGTIEMPKKLTPVSRLQIVRGCIKRLRAEKRNHTPVLMTVFPCSLRLKNESGTTIAVYPGGRVTFCSSSNEQNKRYFGIVTTSLSDEPSNSCHVFVILAAAHAEHAMLAVKFNIECGVAALIGNQAPGYGSGGNANGNSNASGRNCAHFPANCDPIVTAVQKYYEHQQQQRNGGHLGGGLDLDEPLVANSPQPSNDSSVTTSNSDSGIGFRDDSGHQSDRILVVDIQNQRLHIQAAGLSDPQYVDCYAEKSDRSNASNTNSSVLQTCAQSDQIHHSSYASNDSVDNIFHWTTKQVYKSSCLNTGKWPNKNFEEVTPKARKISQGSLERRLSPKVFNNITEMYPISQSLEDIKMQSELYEDLEPSDDFMKKHSLQDLTVLATDAATESQQNKSAESERKVTAWATSLERLLNDTVGLHAFAAFLKKEFSVENAYFWVACEKYRNCANVEERRKMAQYINDRFLSNNASEPVNVDSSGKNLALQQLQEADLNLLQNAQKQIFNLMKFDSYPRFLKSDLYKNNLMREISGENVTLSSDAVDADLLLTSPSAQKTESMKENAEESDCNQRTNRRRRSLLPWTRSRGKSRDRTASNENVSSCSDSRTSLASWDLALPMSLCRVILPEGSSAMLNIQPHQNVYYVISKLLEKRAMAYNSFQVILTATNQAVDLDESATVLAGKEVKIEWRVEFRLDLPDRKSLTVKSKPTHTLGAILGPILIKHGYSLQMVTLCLMSENEVLEPSTLVSFVDKQRIQVLTRSTPTPNLQGWNYHGCGSAKPQQPVNLEEITNHLFQKVLYDKAENYRNPTNENITSAQSEDWSSEHSSRIIDKFLRKDSFHRDKHRRNKKFGEEPSSDKKTTSTRIPMVIAKWKPSSKLDLRFEKDGLYEGLKRCQRGRLEDQRGTEINVELPEFLKDKENTPNGRKKMKKIRKEINGETKTLDRETKVVPNMSTAHQTVVADKNAQEGASSYGTTTITTDHYQTPDFGSGVIDYKRGGDGDNDDHDDDEEANIYANDVLNFGSNSNSTPAVFKEPPPLPPKPKNIAWRLSNGISYNNFDVHSKAIYLDHPTSSFV